MGIVARIVRGLGLLLPLAASQAQPLSYEPVALGWTAAEVERAAQGQWLTLQARARDNGPAACDHACRRVQAVYERLLPWARQQSVHADGLAWRLLIVRLPDVEAMAMPGGQLVVGDPCPTPSSSPSTATSACHLLPALANRHGLITGATGTGKTITLQTLAENFSKIGVPVFMADVKGDLTGITQAGSIGPKLPAS
jgi:hypothetical protein